MTMVAPPHFDKRRRRELRAELFARARMWFPEWRPGGNGSDVLASFLEIAARLDADVIQRLDRVPEKSFRGFLHWLGRRGKSGQVARMPVVFQMSERAETVFAEAPVQLQADAGGTPVIFETEASIRLIASRLDAIVASKGSDEFYLAFPGLAELAAPVPAPSQWRLVTPARFGALQVQLDPPEGLVIDMVLADDAGRKYRVTEAKDGLVKLSEPLGSSPLTTTLPTGFYGEDFHRVDHFAPFDGQERNRQEHALYIGAKDILNIETAALIRLEGAPPLDCTWSYWGKATGEQESGWQTLVLQDNVTSLLKKQKAGAIEEKEINGHVSRWLRAVPVDPTKVTEQQASGLKIAINCTGNDGGQTEDDSSAPGSQDEEETEVKSPVALEAITNTTPVVLQPAFYPFGREPRQFDSFYLSGPEAFGKPKAFIDMEIKLAKGFSGPLNAVGMTSGGQAHSLLAGIGDDSGLRMVHVHSSQGGETVKFLSSIRPDTDLGRPAMFDAQKVGAAVDPEARRLANFSVTDGKEVWVWTASFILSAPPQSLSDSPGYWNRYGAPKDAQNSPIVETCLLTEGDALKVYVVLKDGQVYWRYLWPREEWHPLSNGARGPLKDVKRLVPFDRISDPPGHGTDSQGLAAYTEKGEVIYCERAGAEWKLFPRATPVGTEITSRHPLALLDDNDRIIVTSRPAGNGGASTRIEASSLNRPSQERTLDGQVVGDSLSFANYGDGQLSIVFAIGSPGGTPSLKLWRPWGTPGLIDLTLPSTSLKIERPPINLPLGYALPLENGAIAAIGPSNGAKRESGKTDAVPTSIALRKDLESLPDKSLLVLGPPQTGDFYLVKPIAEVGLLMPSLLVRNQDNVSGRVHALSAAFKAEVKNRETIILSAGDTVTQKGDKLCICRNEDPESGVAKPLYEVIDVKPEKDDNGVEQQYATIKPKLSNASSPRAYFKVLGTSDAVLFDIRPTVHVKKHITAKFDLDQLAVKIENSTYSGGLAMSPFAEEEGDRLVLASILDSEPAVSIGSTVTLMQFSQSSTADTPAAPRNPALSWEYWNGSTWWKIPRLEDGTQNFVMAGHVKFCVPDDLKPTDIVGRAGTWIRARLVGGDYGQESVRVITKTTRDGESVQTVERDFSTINAPLVSSLSVTYELCCAVAPDWVLTFDSGGYRDQTEINLAENARIEVFQSLSTSLRQARPAEPAALAPQACNCGNGNTGDREGLGAQGQDDKGKAIYLGFSEPLQGQGVTLLVLVQESGQSIDPRLAVEAFVEGAFRPVEIKDETRALTESGIITLSIPAPLQRVSLFGQSLYWLRLSPDLAAAEDWQPKIAGIYLNSVWASAGETHRVEVVGRSDGSPSQVFRLAHKDVVDDTLELRIREPLGDDDVNALNLRDPDNVLPEIGLWEGPWIRWRRGDLTTAASDARIFDFDAALGVLTFGDGRRGAIPPIGADNIVAVTYRSGADASGNRVGAWNKPNLISPLRGVQEVLTPQGAAGGNDAQNAEQALLFAPANIAMRDRAITLADFERQAVQSSPDIVQAKAIAGNNGLTLVAVRRGPKPAPTAAMRRALERYLKERSSAAYRRPGALSIVGPMEIEIGISLILTVADLALAGSVAEAVRGKILGLLDTATGGIDELGWPIGSMVSQAELSATISDVPGVLELDQLTVRRLDDLTRSIRANELIVLRENDLSITCLQSEEEVA